MTTSNMHRHPRIWCAIEGTEALSVDDAAAALSGFEAPPDETPDDPPETAGEVEDETEQAPADEAGEIDSDVEDPATDDADDDPDEGNEAGDDEDTEGEPETAIAVPQFWDAEGKEAFAKLPAQAQAVVTKYEEQRNAAVARKLQETAVTRQGYQAKLQQLDEATRGIDVYVSEVERDIAQYAAQDWVKLASELSPQDYQAHRANFEALKDGRKKARQQQAHIEQQQLQHHTAEESRHLASLAPDLAGNAPEAVKSRQAVGRYLGDQGIAPEQMQWITAHEMLIANKARLYDEMMSKSPPKPKPKAEASQTKGVRPKSSGAASNSKTARKRKLATKKVLSVDEAVESLL